MRGILFDARILRPGMTGIGNFARNLLRYLPTDAEPIGILLPVGSPYGSDFPGCRIHFCRIDPTQHPLTELFEQFGVPLFCLRHGYGSFVSFEGRIPILHPGLRTYPFIYDLAFLTVPGSHNFKYSALLRLSQMISRFFSTRVVTISETVKKQIASAFRISPEKILVVYPSDSQLTEPPVPVPGVEHPFFLTVGMTNRRKNLSNLLQGFSRLDERWETCQLVVTGNQQWIQDSAHAAGTEKVVNMGYATAGQLRFLYENAEALIYPSFDEGFGIPLLDAAHFGRPVVCSDIPVFREVLGEGARYFDPHRPESITAALEQTLTSPIHIGDAEVLKKFSWKRSATGFLSNLRRI